MSEQRQSDPVFVPELETLAQAAAQRLRAQVAGSDEEAGSAQQAVVAAAGAALSAGLGLGEIAAAEQAGQSRARAEDGKEMLRAVERCARRRREAEREYELMITRAVMLGLGHREIAAAAQTTHGTVRAVVSRAPDAGGQSSTTRVDVADDHDPGVPEHAESFGDGTDG
jgi:DNA-directed RNA polymerase specialized sigma24 family protein